MAQTFPQLQSPAQNPPPETPDSFGSFGGAVGNTGAAVPSSGGFGVSGGDLAGIGASIAKLLAGATGNKEAARLVGIAASTVQGARAVSSIVQSGANLANIAGVVQAIVGALQAAGVIKNDRDLEAAMKTANAALVATQAALNSTGVGAAVASIINTGMTIYSGLESKQTTGQQVANAIFASTPLGLMDIGGGMSEEVLKLTSPTSHEWQTFPAELMQGQGQQGKAFGTLASALPYVQNKAELGQLINTYKNYIQTTTGIALDDNLNDPYRIDAVPGTGRGQGGVTEVHGKRVPAVDWGSAQTQLQTAIDALYGQLPGDPISGPYGAPGMFLEGEPEMRAWTQHLAREQNAPGYLPTNVPDRFIETGSGETAGSGVTVPARNEGFYGPAELVDYPTSLGYGQSGYPYNDPRGGGGVGFPEPDQFRGEVSPYWQQLMSRQNAAPGTPDFQPNTIGMTGGMRTGIGQPMGAFGGQRSPLAATAGATVSPDITQGLQGQTGFVPGGSKL